MPGLVIRSRRAVLPDGERPASVVVRDGVIVSIGPYDAPAAPAALAALASAASAEDVDLGETALLPGLVDTHVHVNEPGRTEWEGFATATRAAAAGGVTTLIDMPLNSVPPTVSAGALASKRAAARRRCRVDVGFWGGAIPGNLAELRPLHDAGVFGFKCFMSPSGVPEFPPLGDTAMAAVFGEIASLGGLVIVHAEDPSRLAEPVAGGYPAFLASRPPAAEVAAVGRVIELAERTGVRAHILHVSAADCLPPLAAAASRGVRVTAETCPHYLILSAADVPAGGTSFKCCPPIRDAVNREALWRGLADGVIGCVVSDHSPCVPSLKEGDFGSAWGGVSSLELGLPVVWTAARERGFSLGDVVRWMAAGPAALAGLAAKGRIAVGADADLVAFEADSSFTVDPSALWQRHPVTPYAGRELTGVVADVWLRGATAHAPGTEVPATGVPAGRLLRRGA